MVSRSLVTRALGPVLIASALCVPAALAQSPPQPSQAQPGREAGPSPDLLARLQDGRIAMAKAALKLNDAQLKLWGPVEEQLRARFAARQERMAKRRQEGAQGPRGAELSLPDRLDRTSQRLVARAEQLKAFNASFRPFYESLSDEQKAVARVVLRSHRSADRWRHHWAMRQGGAREHQQ
jgi:hypothetical protein